jgi:hypothetical protein
VVLEAGHFVDFITMNRNLLSLGTFVLEWWLVEVEDDVFLCFSEDEANKGTFSWVKARQHAARDNIEPSMKLKAERLPRELLDVDSLV